MCACSLEHNTAHSWFVDQEPIGLAIICPSPLPPPSHGDPADQIIVPTAREQDTVILTEDSLILNYAHVKNMW